MEEETRGGHGCKRGKLELRLTRPSAEELDIPRNSLSFLTDLGLMVSGAL